MIALTRLLRAIDREFGSCPTWAPLIRSAREEVKRQLEPKQPQKTTGAPSDWQAFNERRRRA